MKAIRYYLLSGVLALAFVSCNNSQAQNGDNNSKNSTNIKFEKVALPYETDALEPGISKETVELHHGKHHQSYVDNLNK